MFGQRFLPRLYWAIYGIEKLVKHCADIGTVRRGPRFNQVAEAALGLENACVIREQAEHQAHQVVFERMAGVAVALQRIVEVAHLLDRAHVDWVLLADDMLAIPGDKAEQVDFLVEVLELEVVLLPFVQVVETEARKIGDEHVARQFLFLQAGKIIGGLLVGAVEILAERLVLDEQRALPEQVDVAVLAVDFLDTLFEAGNAPTRYAEHLEERVQERLGVRVLGLGVLPLARKG